MGVHYVTLHDTKKTQWEDLSTHFYLNESSIGKNRVSECIDKLGKLNPFTKLEEHTSELTDKFLSSFKV